MKFFNLDSPLMRGLSKMADLMWLNILTLVCCIPIVTAGASLTAMHFVLLKMVRDEDSYITKDFFRSFKSNIGQATVIWLIMLAVGAVVAADCWVLYKYPDTIDDKFYNVFLAACIVSGILYLIVSIFVFPILSHFVNTVGKTIKNALLMSILVLPKSVLMVVLSLIPIVLLIYVPQVIPLIFLFGFTGPGFADALLYNKTFKRFEPEEEEVADDMAFSIAAEEETAEDATDSIEESEGKAADITAEVVEADGDDEIQE